MLNYLQRHFSWISFLVSIALSIIIGVYPAESKIVVSWLIEWLTQPTSIIIILLVILLFKRN